MTQKGGLHNHDSVAKPMPETLCPSLPPAICLSRFCKDRGEKSSPETHCEICLNESSVPETPAGGVTSLRLFDAMAHCCRDTEARLGAEACQRRLPCADRAVQRAFLLPGSTPPGHQVSERPGKQSEPLVPGEEDLLLHQNPTVPGQHVDICPPRTGKERGLLAL